MKKESIGETIKKVRLRLGLSGTDLGELLGVSGNTVSRWEIGTITPDAPEMIRLALEALVIRYLSNIDDRIQLAVSAANSSFDDELASARKRAPRIREELSRLQQEVVQL